MVTDTHLYCCPLGDNFNLCFIGLRRGVLYCVRSYEWNLALTACLVLCVCFLGAHYEDKGKSKNSYE